MRTWIVGLACLLSAGCAELERHPVLYSVTGAVILGTGAASLEAHHPVVGVQFNVPIAHTARQGGVRCPNGRIANGHC